MPSMTMASQSPAAGEALTATVDFLVDIVPCPNDGATACIRLAITARNRTRQEIPLTHPYYLPARRVNEPQAWDGDGPLDILHDGARTGVGFRGRAPIPPGGDYSWNLTFKRRLPERFESDMLIIGYKVISEHIFQGWDVLSHTFNITFRIQKPGWDRWRRLKVFRVHARDTRRVISQTTQERDATVWKVSSVPIGRNEPVFEFHLVCIYGYSSRVMHAITAAATLVATIVGQSLIGALL